MIIDCKETKNDPSKHLTSYTFTFEPVFNDLLRFYQTHTQAFAQQYWCVSENETRFILTQIEEISGQSIVKYHEAFVVVNIPYEPDKCLVLFYSD